MNNNNTISSEYYDNTTYTMLLESITNDDKEYMKNNTYDTIEGFMNKRWTTIINALPSNYYNQYYSQTNQEDRNNWFKKYLNYPTKNISEMPDFL
jgi:hypothetical protein